MGGSITMTYISCVQVVLTRWHSRGLKGHFHKPSMQPHCSDDRFHECGSGIHPRPVRRESVPISEQCLGLADIPAVRENIGHRVAQRTGAVVG